MLGHFYIVRTKAVFNFIFRAVSDLLQLLCQKVYYTLQYFVAVVIGTLVFNRLQYKQTVHRQLQLQCNRRQEAIFIKSISNLYVRFVHDIQRHELGSMLSVSSVLTAFSALILTSQLFVAPTFFFLFLSY